MPFNVNPRSVMADAFATLLQERPIEKISVGDICNICNITRPTFYRYFKDKYDLMLYVFQGDSANIFAQTASKSTDHFDLALSLLQRIQQRPDFYKVAFSYYGENSFYEAFKKLLISGMKSFYEPYGIGKIPQNEYDYLCIAYIAMVADTIREWTQNNYREEASSIVKIINECCPKELRSFITHIH